MRAFTLADLYAQLPSIDCTGQCVESCGPIVAANGERMAMEIAGGKVFSLVMPEGGTVEDIQCGYLDEHKRCSIHANRPLLCRLWGVVQGMPCTFGCRPTRVLSDAEGKAFLDQLIAIAGPFVRPETS